MVECPWPTFYTWLSMKKYFLFTSQPFWNENEAKNANMSLAKTSRYNVQRSWVFHLHCISRVKNIISPLPVKPGGLYISSQSVRLSVLLSVCPSTWCPSTQFSKLFSVVLWDIDLKFGIWICLDIIQIKFDIGCVWPTFTWVIALC